MLYLEYIDQEYEGSRIDFRPGSEREILGLRDMVMHNLLIENPACTFAGKMRSGKYEGRTEEDIASDAEKANLLSDFWGGKKHINAMMLLSKVIQELINIKIGSVDTSISEISVSEAEEMLYADGEYVVPPDWFIIEDDEGENKKGV